MMGARRVPSTPLLNSQANLKGSRPSFSASTSALDYFGSETASPVTDDFQDPQSDGTPEAGNQPRQFWKTAAGNTRHFLGGLIPHPVESTRHYSVLRHSHGIVPYRGLATSVTITIFSDRPLPADRTIWLQQKGWSGNTGLKLKTAVGRNGNWINVTPESEVRAEQLEVSDERAWQRDIKHFLKSSSKNKTLRTHRPAETALVRIPFASNDGYFRLVVCDGSKKALCPSPVFRVLSLSTSSASLKGASLSTMPLEIGIKALTLVAQNTAARGVGPVVGVVQNRFGRYIPGALTQQITTNAYSTSGLSSKVEMMNDSYDSSRGATFEACAEEMAVVGSDEGPQPPYPLQFSGKVVEGAKQSNQETGLPTARLSGVRDNYKTCLSGRYFGWALIEEKHRERLNWKTWKPAIIIGSSPGSTVAPKKVIDVYVIEDFAGKEFCGAGLSVIVMGYLRPVFGPCDIETFDRETTVDVMLVRQSLERPSWAAEVTLTRVRSGRSMTDRYVEARQFGQRQTDRIPFHNLYIRMPTMELKDAALGNGGIFVSRKTMSLV